MFLCPLIVLEMSSPDGNESNSSIGGENRKLLFERSVMNCGVRRTRGSAYFLNFFEEVWTLKSGGNAIICRQT